MYFVYRIHNLVDKKFYISYHEANDPFWCNPPRRLSELGSGIMFPTAVREDIKKHSPANFLVEVLQGAATQADADKLLNKFITPELRANPACYNRPLGRKKAK